MARLRLILALPALASLAACAHAPANGTSGDPVTLADLPGWARDSWDAGPYLDIDAVMKRERLTRLQAVEAQNRTRDRLDARPGGDFGSAYAEALAEVRAGHAESGWKPVEFREPGDYVAALDMDETLLMQWYDPGRVKPDLTGLIPDGVGPEMQSVPEVKFAPGAEQLILSLKADPRCRGVVIFSAKTDAAALDIVRKWKFRDGSPALRHLDGVFTRNHLVLGPKALIPSKDLRILDPELKHVVLVDDNPGRVFQPWNLRAHPKFDAERLARAEAAKDALIVRYYDRTLAQAGREIAESAAAAQKLKIPFAQAFLPYSYAGVRVYQALLGATGSRAKARLAARLHPELQDAVFAPQKR